MKSEFKWAVNIPIRLVTGQSVCVRRKVEERDLSKPGVGLLHSISVQERAEQTLQHLAPRRAIIRPAPQERRQTQRQGPWIRERLFSTNVKHVSQLTCQECGSCFKIHSLRQLHEQPKERISIEPAFWYIPYRWTVCIRTGKEPSPWPQTKSSGLLQKEMKEIKQLFQICLCFPWGFVKCSGGDSQVNPLMSCWTRTGPRATVYPP